MSDRRGMGYATAAGRRYEAYIKSKAWAKRRLQYWRQYGRSCKVPGCGATTSLHVHHHTYERFGHELMTDLVGLCEKHHDAVHDLYDKKRHEESLTRVTETVTGINLHSEKPKKPKRQSAKQKTDLKVERRRSNVFDSRYTTDPDQLLVGREGKFTYDGGMCVCGKLPLRKGDPVIVVRTRPGLAVKLQKIGCSVCG